MQMLVNEDFFNDLEVKDEDIVIDDGDIVDMNNADSLFNDYIKRRFSHTICFQMYDNNCPTNAQIMDMVQYLKKRMFYLFQAFEVEHSEIFVSDDMSYEYMKDREIEITDCKDFKHLRKANYYRNRFIVIYVNYPQFSTKQLIRFM